MRYRAILIDDGNTAQERATEIYSQSIEDVREWAAKILKNAASENAVVMVYQTLEQQIESIRRQKAEPTKRDARGRCEFCLGTGIKADAKYCACQMGVDLARQEARAK